MPCRSRSLMIEELSSMGRSVKSGTICGVVTRTIKNEKNPASVSATAAIAARRPAPSEVKITKKGKNVLTLFAPYRSQERRAQDGEKFRSFMVTVRLTAERNATKNAGQ